MTIAIESPSASIDSEPVFTSPNINREMEFPGNLFLFPGCYNSAAGRAMVGDVLTVSSECALETHGNDVIQGQTSFLFPSV